MFVKSAVFVILVIASGLAIADAGDKGAPVMLGPTEDAVVPSRYVERYSCGYLNKSGALVRVRPPLVIWLSGNPRTGGDVRITCPNVWRR